MKISGFIFFGVILSAYALGFSSPVFTKNIIWEEFSRWTVSVNSNFGYGCKIESSDQDLMLVVGFDNSDGTAFVAFADDSWRSIEEGKEYELEMDFDGDEFWGDTFTGMRDSSDRGVLVLWGDGSAGSTFDDWLRDIAIHHRLNIQYDGKRVGSVSLRGTTEAI